MAIFRRKVMELGGSLAITIPPEIVEHIGIKAGDELVMQDKEKGKGKYFAGWNAKDDKN